MTAEGLLATPPGSDRLPSYELGWSAGGDGQRSPYLSYVPDAPVENWSADLEALHEESSRTHFLDVWTRRAMLERLGPLPPAPVVADLGCSTGHLLEDLRRRLPDATLIGVDLVAAGLVKAHAAVPEALLTQADVCALPLEDASLHAATSANLLEHVPDDTRALAELRRVLRPGARAVLVVPAGAGTYDYYDRFLGHVRRYRRGELAAKAAAAGLEVIEDLHLGSLLYPAFWLVKKRNRRRFDHLRGEQLRARVERDIARTNDSLIGRASCSVERVLVGRGVRAPWGIRGLTVVRRPGSER